MRKKINKILSIVICASLMATSFSVRTIAEEEDSHFVIDSEEIELFDETQGKESSVESSDKHFEIGAYKEKPDPDLMDMPGEVVDTPLIYEEDECYFEKYEESEEEIISSETAPEYGYKYDPRDYGMVTTVKNQGDSENCETYAAAATMESYLIKKGYTNNSIDLSEIYLGSFWLENGKTYNEKVIKSLGMYAAHDAFVNSFTVAGVPESFMPTPDLTAHIDSYTVNIPDNLENTPGTYLCKSIMTPNPQNREEVKANIKKYGGLYVSVNGGSLVKKNINTRHDSAWSNTNGDGHAVEVVGWDDNFPASSFAIQPSGNGAWLYKNSYGVSSDDSGFFWVSYYERPIEYGYVYELIPSGSYVRKITTTNTEMTLYVGQTSDPITATVAPDTAWNKNYTFNYDGNSLRVNGDNSITALSRPEKRQSLFSSGWYCPKQIISILPEDGIDENARAAVTFEVLPNEVKHDHTVMIPDNGPEEVTGLSTYPVENRNEYIELSSGYLNITGNQFAEVIKEKAPYGSFNITAKLDEENYTVPAYVYCTKLDLGEDFTIEGENETTISARTILSKNLDEFKGKVTAYSSDSDVLSIEPDGLNFKLTPHKNGYATISAWVQDPLLTNDKFVSTNFVCVHVTGIEEKSNEPSATEPAVNPSDPGGEPSNIENPTDPDPSPAIEPEPKTEPVEPKKEETTVTYYKGAYYKKVGNEAHLTSTLGTKKSITVPDTVKIGDKKLKVTKIEKKAFSGDKKVKSVTIGKNVKVIEKKAFYDCSNLKTVTIKSKKIKTVGSKALKNIKKGAVIKVPKKMKERYESILKKRKDAATKIK